MEQEQTQADLEEAVISEVQLEDEGALVTNWIVVVEYVMPETGDTHYVRRANDTITPAMAEGLLRQGLELSEEDDDG